MQRPKANPIWSTQTPGVPPSQALHPLDILLLILLFPKLNCISPMYSGDCCINMKTKPAKLENLLSHLHSRMNSMGLFSVGSSETHRS
ncbi:hypothetical protein ACRRTK_014875 [Alexandromys fortis]